ncbi:putative permease [Hyella patelloides LEGE 07179]|uniref:Putative permease n=1 Tax=Hyella patelloides LEGE 07179 TaxID=945734 RepID=A0A563VXY4_9CYAN|nr:LptF/LptG family permease [Hyella patelloides]VEP16279.1 putative permease [Hyella patelloides LEGE 07179]
MINSILNLYLFKQLIILFCLTVGLLSGVGVAIGTISDLAYQINNYNLPLVVALKIFVLKIPEYVAYGLPIGTLLTTLIVYGRLNSDRELIAFRSVGISIYKIVIPAVYFSFVITILTLITNEAIVPQANYQVILLQQPFLPETKVALQKKDIFYPEYESINTEEKELKRLYYAEKFDGNKLNNIVVISWKNQQLTQIITAKYAYWNAQLELWNMQQGIIDNLGKDILNSLRKTFNNYQIALPATFFKIVTQERDPDAMSLTQARDYLELIFDSGNLPKIRLFQVRIQQKLAFPFICIIFALIGSSVGATFSNLNRGRSFGLCIAIVFSYYLLGFMIGSLGIAGLISPLIAAWLPNAIGLGFGCWLLKSANCTV